MAGCAYPTSLWFRNVRTLAIVATLALGAARCHEPPPRRLVVRAGLLLDGTGAPPAKNVRVVAEDGTITAVEPDTDDALEADADMLVIDARQLTVMPGLVSVGVQLFAPVGERPASVDDVVLRLHTQLRAGTTTLVDIGSPTEEIIAMRRFVGTGRQRGPRLFVSGAVLAEAQSPLVEPRATTIVREAAQAKAAARALVDSGVDFVAVAPVPSPHDNAPNGRPVCAAVVEAQRQERRAVGLAVNRGAVVTKTNCKVDALVLPGSVEDRAYLQDGSQVAHAPQSGDTRDVIATLARSEPAVRPTLVTKATYDGARIVGLHEALGRITVGYRADLVAVELSPPSVRTVIIDGVVQKLNGPRWYDALLARTYALLASLGGRGPGP